MRLKRGNPNLIKITLTDNKTALPLAGALLTAKLTDEVGTVVAGADTAEMPVVDDLAGEYSTEVPGTVTLPAKRAYLIIAGSASGKPVSRRFAQDIEEG